MKIINNNYSYWNIIFVLFTELLFIKFGAVFYGNTSISLFVFVFSFLIGIALVGLCFEVVIYEKNEIRLFFLILLTIFQFICFWAFQYYLLERLVPGSFENLNLNPVSLLLDSTMTFLFNPSIDPISIKAESLILINLIESMILVLLILQNMYNFRKNENYIEK